MIWWFFTSRERYGDVQPPHIRHGMMDKGWKCGGKPFNIYSWSILNFWILKSEANHSFSSHCFLFKCSFPIQCFWWLNDSMLMLATVKKVSICVWVYIYIYIKIYTYIYIYMYIYIHIWTQGLWVIQDEWTLKYWYLQEHDLLGGGSLDARMKWRSLDLKYQQNEPDFVQSPKPRWSNSHVLLCQLSMYGNYCMWEYSLIFFGENGHQIIQFLQKIFWKTGKKIYIYQTIILHVLQLLKKDKSITKTWTKKEKKRISKDFACKKSDKFLHGWCSIIDTWDCSSYCTWIQIKLQFLFHYILQTELFTNTTALHLCPICTWTHL